MVDISRFKNKKVNIERLVNAAKADSSKKKFEKDERFWQPTTDAAGNGYAVIRFLPSANDDLPWTRYWDHAFQGPSGQWFIEKSLTSIDLPCPVAEANSVLWNAGPQGQELARKRKRRLHYVTNIYVINDQGNPDNNGKVFLYAFGKKIFDKIMESMNPEFPDETPVSPFDMWEGADFALKIRQVEGYRNYDKSEFKKPSPLLGGDDAKLSEVVEKLHPLTEFLDPANYKSYDELLNRMNTVLGESKNNAVMAAKIDAYDDDIPFDTKPAKSMPTQDVADGDADDVEDAMSYFNRVAQDD